MKKTNKKNSWLESFIGIIILIALAFWFFSDGNVDEQIAELEAEVQAVPVSDYDKNLEVYYKLLELDPDNERYKQKIATYAENKSLAEGTSLRKSYQSLPPLYEAKDYKIIVKMDATFPINRVRYVLNISSPEAKTFEQRAQTTLKAAIDVQKQTGANIVAARLFIYEQGELLGSAIARAEYSNDGKDWGGDKTGLRNGNWEVYASTGQITEQQKKLASFWFKNEHKFQIDDGFGDKITDETELKKYVAKEFKMTEDEVFNVMVGLISETAKSKIWPEN
ncbi:MAG: DUF4875 domain-containing protein [Proteobacteria bacterium]|nr:DUF4875 domain-containing protein [Pseudomonadota bacterium]